MSVLNAFLSTWTNARATFGEGTPPTGERFDQSATLNQLTSSLDEAAPGGHWTGGAATHYAAVNFEHQRVIAVLGKLDQRLASQVDASAQVVTKGRRDLDSVRTWVLAAAASVPKNPAGERTLLPIVSKGLSQVSAIVQRADGELRNLGGNIRTISDEYRALGEGQRFGGEGASGSAEPVDFKQSPPPPSYPVNEVVAEATDLDGNHVVLRRGYHDATTQRGFGWDKAYWRHHVVNPNVFKDLIFAQSADEQRRRYCHLRGADQPCALLIGLSRSS